MDLLHAPRGDYGNASELAVASKVSVMSAFRLVRHLRQEGFLEEHEEPLGLVRRKESLRRWQLLICAACPNSTCAGLFRSRVSASCQRSFIAYNARLNLQCEPAARACLRLFGAGNF